MSERDLFIATLKITGAAERSAWLDQECGGDAALRQRIDVLLQAFDKAGSLLDNPLVAVGPTVDEPITEAPGTVIGPYKLLQQIGEGGMGVVWMAEQNQPVQRKVALKVIKAGMDSRQVIARFEAERQALAMMDHVNIARVFDGGATESGRPYFVMELVHGVPITTYCDDNHLTPRERLELFVPVCQAIQHAHQKGIIHRDIKPSNVMITLYDGKPVPKVIDFGVAKATEQKLTERTLFTQYRTMVGTLEYMSPEQAEMSALGVDTRSDIYSLGVLLYELLTGSTPLSRKRVREAAYAEILRMIKEEEPPKPSTRLSDSGEALASISAQRKMEPAKLSKLVRGELDWIVMKTLEKDRNRRYETANAFAADVQRYLSDEAVEACPPSAVYRVRKFVRRHKGPVLAALLVVLALVGGVIGTAWGLVQADQALEAESEQRRVAEENSRIATAASEAERRATKQEAEQRKTAERESDLAKRHLYIAQIQVAQQAWVDGDVAHVQEILQKHVPQPGQRDLRGWEWDYLNAVCHRELLTIGSDKESIYSSEWSPDSKRLATVVTAKTAEAPRSVRVWDAVTGHLQLSLNGEFVNWSPDGTQLAITDKDDRLKVCDAQTGHETATLPAGDFQGREPSWSPDGKRLAWVSNQRTAKVWDIANQKVVLDLPDQYGWVRWSPDGKRIITVAANDDGYHVWDSSTGKQLFSIVCSERNFGFLGVELSADGCWVAARTDKDTIRIVAMATGEQVAAFNHQDVRLLGWSPNNRWLATMGDDDSYKIWDVTDWRLLNTLRCQKERVRGTFRSRAIRWSPDGQRLAVENGLGIIVIWDVATGEEAVRIRGHAGAVRGWQWSPDGEYLASIDSGQGTLKVWGVAADQEALVIDNVWSAVWKPDGSQLAAIALGEYPGLYETVNAFFAPLIVQIRDAENGQVFTSLRGHSAGAADVVWSPDGKQAADVGLEEKQGKVWRTIRIWDTAGWFLLREWTAHTMLSTLRWSPDSKLLASRGTDFISDGRLAGQNRADGQGGVGLEMRIGVKVWDAATGRQLFALAPAWTPTWSPDSRKLAYAQENHLRICDAATGQELFSLGHGHPNGKGIPALTWSPNGEWLVSAGADGTKVWDANKRQPVCTLHADQDGGLSYVAFAWSPANNRLAVGTAGIIRIWDTATWQQVIVLRGSWGDVSTLAWSSDGKRLLSNSRDGTLRIWDACKRKAWPPSAAKAHGRLASFWADSPDPKLRDPQRAVEHAKKSLQISPDNSEVWLSLGIGHYRAGDWKLALAALEKSLTLNFDDRGRAFLYRAMALWRCEQREEARKCYEHAIKVWDVKTPLKNEAAELLGIKASPEPESIPPPKEVPFATPKP